MVVQSANINIQPVLTKEQIVYDDAMKSMRLATVKLKISQEGINVDDLSQDQLDNASKLFDEMDVIQRDFNMETQKIQQDVNSRMGKLQEDSNKKSGIVQNRYRELINLMKGIETVDQGDCSANVCNTNMTKEREEKVRRDLAEEIARSKEIKTE